MFKPFKGGSSKVIQEGKLAKTVYFPPVGYGYDQYTQELIETDVLVSSDIPEDQVWVRPLPPENWDKKRREEKKRQAEDSEYFDQELEDYRSREWHRRLYGVWVMINGEHLFLTGANYFYLTHWRLDVGYPDFRKPDVEWWWFWAWNIENPNSYGMIELTRRRQGKSARAGCAIYEMISRRKEAYGGIQSKTVNDAKKNVFAKAIIQPFKKLPDFMRPVYDESKGITPTTELRFFKTQKKGKVDYEYNEDEELESFIDYRASGKQAYDGDKLHCYIGDEIGKTIEEDVYDRHDVVKPCLENPDTKEIIGKAIYTTTVEEMESGGQAFKDLWLDSDAEEAKMVNGRTKTGLHRYFMSTVMTGSYNKYGEPDTEDMRIFHQAERDRLASDPRKLASYIRKYPFTWEEALRADSDSCIYNSMKLTERLDILEIKENMVERGNFIWKNGERDTEVVWEKNSNGRWYISMLPEDSKQNLVKRIGSTLVPNNHTTVVSGWDPYDHDVTVDGKGSMGAGAIYHKWDPSVPDEMSENFICIYHARPQKSKILYEDAIKTCVFYGCLALIEDNKPGMIQYFEDRGYQNFLMHFKGKPGIHGGTKAHLDIAEETEVFIEDHCHKVAFKQLINDWLGFDLSNTTKFDLGMASGYALIAASKMKRKANLMKKKVQVKKYYRKNKVR